MWVLNDRYFKQTHIQAFMKFFITKMISKWVNIASTMDHISLAHFYT